MIDWPDDLVDDIARRRSVLFLGAGVSKNSSNEHGERPKDWKEFLLHATERISDAANKQVVSDCIEASDLLTACELVRKHLRPDQFKTVLLEEYSDKRFEASAVHDDIIRLDSRYVLTTNFDKIYENRANHIQQSTVLVKHFYDDDVADVLRRSQRSVLKVHGTIDTPDRTIFTRGDYAAARSRNAGFYRILESLFMTHTFVFLGASMSDPDIQLLLEDYAYRFGGTRPHYMVMPEGAAPAGVIDVMEESMNLRLLAYSPTDNHKELGESLALLRDLVDAQREVLLETMDW